MNQACLSNRCVGRSVETRPGLGRGQGGSPRPSKHGCGAQGDRWGIVWRSRHLASRQLAIGPPSNSRLALYCVCLSPVNSPAHTPASIVGSSHPSAHASTAKSVSRLFIAFVITEMGRPRIALTVDSLPRRVVDRDRIAPESRLKSVLHVFPSLGRIRKPMRNTTAQGIAHCAFPLLQAMRATPWQALGFNHPRPLVSHPPWALTPR